MPITVKADSDLVYRQSSLIDLKIPCVFEDVAYCSDVANCNITINYQNGTNLVNNNPMEYNQAYFNYTLNESLTSTIGKYPTSIVCKDQGGAGFTSFTFEITTTGFPNEFLNNIVIFICILLAIILFILGLNKEDAWITILSSFLFILAGFWIYYHPIAYLPEFVNFGLSLILWGFGAYILLRTAYEFSDIG